MNLLKNRFIISRKQRVCVEDGIMTEESRKRTQPVSKEDGRNEKDEKMKRIRRENRVNQNTMRKEGKELMRTAKSNPCSKMILRIISSGFGISVA